jgi:PAS domain S-box-containing protein
MFSRTSFTVALIWGATILSSLHAQGVATARISGTLTDDSGAVLVGAAVQTKNPETGSSWSAVTDSRGRFAIADLPIGSYDARASSPGFDSVVRSAIVLTVGSDLVIDFTLKAGQALQDVIVSAQVSRVETQTAAVSSLVTSEQLSNLPLNGRNFEQLIGLAPGVSVAASTLLQVGATAANPIYGNQSNYSISGSRLEYYGLTLEEWQGADFQRLFHPQDVELAMSEVPGKLQDGSPFEYEARLKRGDGEYRWFHYRCNPMLDELGRITRWYCAGTDIEDRKAAEQRLLDENVSLREELDKASMFEEIVGTSAALQKVLSCISKVAPTDSSVLITGETGTGKELVARAIHRRSRRSSHQFVSVNCAVIPRDLIASELFGHEKGAFTGATQRRLGRFELAEKGTIFLDEVGELPAETQIALLRVLQEREFERIGGIGSIRTDVRVIAATNRDLESAILAGTFRSDLFYRLNVFPVEMPPLRERREDIPLLVRYFLNRYARKAGRHFTAVDKKSLDLLQAYTWPGNIRELQDVIERSVIVSETETFSVDGSWLSRQRSTVPEIQPGLFNRNFGQEKAVIEAALRKSGGRVSGPWGAAAKLGIPGSTLESKIKALKINKNRFKGADLSKYG